VQSPIDVSFLLEQSIIGFRQDAQGDWVAELACGHTQHVRHNPPWMMRSWVLTESGRAGFLGHKLNCVKCDESAPPDFERS
jgi:Protein of unknown function (DUF3565)